MQRQSPYQCPYLPSLHQLFMNSELRSFQSTDD
ncbi:hypothetical protein GCK32_016798 [Trichostrongylus colubriformis]|uniref:Uncharacterized protein n=1 Tax=Trichostrongylus colubriformis TaxID=6319 RepID=A0AAN8FSC3_TRICO